MTNEIKIIEKTLNKIGVKITSKEIINKVGCIYCVQLKVVNIYKASTTLCKQEVEIGYCTNCGKLTIIPPLENG